MNQLKLCQLVFVPIFQNTLAYVLPKYSNLTNLLNWALYNRYYSANDFENNWLKVYIEQDNYCEKFRKLEARKKLKAMTLKDFGPAVMLYGACLIVSLLICIIEFLVALIAKL